MSDGLLIRICGLGILCAAACVILRQIRSELTPFLRMGGMALIFGALIPLFGEVLESASAMSLSDGVAPYVKVMFRALGISLLTKITGDVCRDTGEGSLAGGVETAGKLLILLLCVPLIEEVLGYASKILDGT